MRRLGATSGADQVAVLLKLARNAEQKLSDVDQAIGFLRQILDVDATQRVRVPGAGAAAARRASAGTTWSRCWPSTPTPRGRPAASRPSWRCAWPSPTSGRRSSTRPRAPRRRWRRCCRWRPATSPALLSLARLHEGGRALGRGRRGARAGGRRTRRRRRRSAEIQFRNAQILLRKEADAGRDRAGAAAGAGRRPDPPADAGGAGEDGARCEGRRAAGAAPGAGAGDGDRRRRSASALLQGGRVAVRRTARARRPRRCRTSSGWSLIDPTEIARARAAGRRAGRLRAASTRRPASWPSWSSELTKARRGKDAARWHTAARHAGRGARRPEGRGRQLRRRLQAGSEPPGDGGGAGPAGLPGAATSRARASTTGRCCCRTSTRRRPASRRPRST